MPFDAGCAGRVRGLSDLQRAQQLGLDFVVLESAPAGGAEEHAELSKMDWQGFVAWREQSTLPIYVAANDMDVTQIDFARSYGAQGVVLALPHV